MSKRILIVMNDFGIGGVQRLVINTAKEMLSRGHDVHILTLVNEKKNSLIGDNPVKKENHKFIKLGRIYNIFSYYKVWSYIHSLKPDVIISQMTLSNVAVRLTGKLAGVGKVITFEQSVYDTVKSKKFYFIESLLQYLGDKVVASSPAVVESLVNNGIREDKIKLIYNAISIPKVYPEKNWKLKESLGIKRDDFVFVNVARWVHQKGIDVLINAFTKTDSNCVLLLIGWGAEEQKYKQLTKDLKIDSRVFFLTGRSDVYDILTICDVFVMPSRYEGFSIALLEAMAATLPIIVSNFESGKQLIQDGKNGLVVPVENVDALAIAMNKLYQDSDLRSKIAKNARIRVEDFGIDKYVDKILEL